VRPGAPSLRGCGDPRCLRARSASASPQPSLPSEPEQSSLLPPPS
jgi:hypothetical protein